MNVDRERLLLYVLVRAVHMCACLGLLSMDALELFVLGACSGARAVGGQAGSLASTWRRIRRVGFVVCLPLAVVSGAAWFVVVTANMSDSSLRDALHPDALALVWSHTQFGAVSHVRAAALIAATVAGIVAAGAGASTRLRRAAVWAALVVNVVLVASLAGWGHGVTGRWTAAHLIADVIHLVITAIWPVGLLPFALLLASLRRLPSDQRTPALARLVSRFSALALACVILLLATGILNSCSLITSFDELGTTAYGRVLIAKVAIFLLMIAAGSLNRLVLTPRLTADWPAEAPHAARAARLLQYSIAIETVLCAAVLVAVAVLGVLAPSGESGVG